MIPDLDIVTHVRGRINYLLKHRGASHSFLALTGMGIALGSILHLIYPSTPWSTIVFWTLIGTFSHGIADLLNSYGAQLFWPFNRKKITLDMIMLSDPIVFLIFLVSLIISITNPDVARASTITAFMFSFIYLGFREYGRRAIRNKLREQFKINQINRIKVLPAMYRPFNWAFLIYLEDNVLFGIYKGKEPKIIQALPKWDENDPCICQALKGKLAEIFTSFTPYLYIQKDEEGTEAKVRFMDLRYWSQDDFLYTGEVKILPNGKIAEQTFYPAGHSKTRGIILDY